jgi:hypothetical protein
MVTAIPKTRRPYSPWKITIVLGIFLAKTKRLTKPTKEITANTA